MRSDTSYKILLTDEQSTQDLGVLLAKLMPRGIVYLKGELGAGKTYFSQAVIRAAGFQGRVKSPTYTLVEPYELAHRNIYHFDLYRLQDEEELLFIGCDEYLESAQVSAEIESTGSSHISSQQMIPNLCLIEWPEKAASILPSADIELTLEYLAQDNVIENSPVLGRQLTLTTCSQWGREVKALIEHAIER